MIFQLALEEKSKFISAIAAAFLITIVAAFLSQLPKLFKKSKKFNKIPYESGIFNLKPMLNLENGFFFLIPLFIIVKLITLLFLAIMKDG